MNSFTAFWNRISAKYDQRSMKKYDDAYKQTIALSKQYLKESDRVFDFACGTGITTIPLAKHVKQIDAIDISPQMINIAQEKVASQQVKNIRFSVTDIFDKDIVEDAYDVVMAFNILYFFEDIDEVLSRIYRLLKPRGIFLSATDCVAEKKSKAKNKSTAANKMGLLPYTKKLKKADLKSMIENNGFEIVEEKNLFDDPPNYYISAKKL